MPERPRVIRDPNHPDFPHGTKVGAQRRWNGKLCACPPCRYEQSRQRRSRAKLEAMRRAQPVAAEPYRRKVQGWIDAGYRVADIAAVCGLSGPALHNLRSGKTTRIQATSAQYLDKVTPSALEKARYCLPDASHARQMLGSLQANGWPVAELMKRLGLDGGGISSLHSGITRRRYEKIRALYAELECTPGPSDRARAQGAKNGWHPPQHYDESGRFLPWSIRRNDEREAGAERAESGKARRLEVVHEVAVRGTPILTVADWYGLSDRTIGRYLRELGIDLFNDGAVTRPVPGQDEVVARCKSAFQRVDVFHEPAHDVWDGLVADLAALRAQAEAQVPDGAQDAQRVDQAA